MGTYTATFPIERLDTTIASLRKFDFYARAHMVTDVIGPEITAAVSSQAPPGHHYVYPSTTPVETRDLQRSFYPTTATLPMGVTMLIRSRKKYARFVLDGTGPHTITARNVPFLFYYSELKNGWRRVRSVNHPGSRANHYTAAARALLEARAIAEVRIVMRDFPG